MKSAHLHFSTSSLDPVDTEDSPRSPAAWSDNISWSRVAGSMLVLWQGTDTGTLFQKEQVFTTSPSLLRTRSDFAPASAVLVPRSRLLNKLLECSLTNSSLVGSPTMLTTHSTNFSNLVSPLGLCFPWSSDRALEVFQQPDRKNREAIRATMMQRRGPLARLVVASLALAPLDFECGGGQ